MSDKYNINLPFDDDTSTHEEIDRGKLFAAHRKTIQSNILSESSPKKHKAESGNAETKVPSKETSLVKDNLVSNVLSSNTKAVVEDKIESSAAACLPKLTSTSKAGLLTVNSRQRGNPILKYVRNVAWEYGDIIPDYEMGKATCALFLSLRYHNLNPQYIHGRLKQLGRSYDLRVLLVQVDVKDPHHSLKELAKICLLSDVTLIVAFSAEEVGRYLETYKAYEHKPPDLIMEKTESNFLSQFTDCMVSNRKVNKTDAMTLLASFGSFEKLVTAQEEDISLCPGLGPQKAKRLHDVLHEPFLAANVKKKNKKIDSRGGSGEPQAGPSGIS